MRNILDDYLLELILMDSLVFISGRHIPDAERIIQSFLPSGSYDHIIARYDALSEDRGDEDVELLVRWQRCASRRNTVWKQMMVERLLQIFCHAGCAGCQGPVEVATLAHKIGATQECRLVFARSLGNCENKKPGFSEKPGFCFLLRLGARRGVHRGRHT